MNRVLVFRSRLLAYSETFIKEQALAMRRWQPVLVGDEPQPGGLSLDGLNCIFLKPAPGDFLQVMAWKTARKFRRVPPGVLEALAAQRAGLVHVHFGLDAVRYESVLTALGLPIVITLHGYDINQRREWWESGKGRRKNIRYPQRLLSLASRPDVRFIAVSEAVRAAALAFGIPEQKVTTCHIGIDTSRFSPGPVPLSARPPNCLFVGRLEEKKGVRYLIDAFAQVRNAVPEARLTVVGDGKLHAELQRQAESQQLPVRFVGKQAPEVIKQFLDASRVLCLPSVTLESGDSEGLGMVLLEAQSSGVPVVTSSKGGVDALLHGKTGFHHAERDVDAIAGFILTLLQDDALADAFSAAAVDFVRSNFDISDCTARLELIYDELCAAAAPATGF